MLILGILEIQFWAKCTQVHTKRFLLDGCVIMQDSNSDLLFLNKKKGLSFSLFSFLQDQKLKIFALVSVKLKFWNSSSSIFFFEIRDNEDEMSKGNWIIRDGEKLCSIHSLVSYQPVYTTELKYDTEMFHLNLWWLQLRRKATWCIKFLMVASIISYKSYHTPIQIIVIALYFQYNFTYT